MVKEPVETVFDHFFITHKYPISALQFEGFHLVPATICSLGWWVRGAVIETQRVRNHLAIQTTYPGHRQPNIEVSVRSEGGTLYLDIESAYLYDLKGMGLGSCAFLRSAKAAQLFGCQYIAVQASGGKSRDLEGDSGHYSWPRMGFDASLTPNIQASLSGRVESLAGIETVRETVALYSDIWKTTKLTLPLQFSLGKHSSDLTYLRRYLQERHLLL